MTKPWVKVSLAPGSKTVMDYLAVSQLKEPLEQLKFHLVGYGAALTFIAYEFTTHCHQSPGAI